MLMISGTSNQDVKSRFQTYLPDTIGQAFEINARGRRFAQGESDRMCGVVGLIGYREAATEAFLGLTTLQHRGQDAAGILTYDTLAENPGFHRVKDLGLVESVFNRDNMRQLTGGLALGHARYSTVGHGGTSDVQPFILSYPFGLGLVHNGNVVNGRSLATRLKTEHRRHLLTQSDSEILLNWLAQALAQTNSRVGEAGSTPSFQALCTAVDEVYRSVQGSYSVVTLVAGAGLAAFRDPNGIRPLFWGRKKDPNSILPTGESHMVASESASLAFLGYEPVRDLKPGELLWIDLEGRVQTAQLVQKPHRPCMFEWVYFASPESVIDGVPVYGARLQLGRQLASRLRSVLEVRGLKPDMIVPVPETSRIAAIALAEELKIPYRETLIKNRYIKRTFILDSQEKRQKAVNLKLSPVRSEIEGKRILLVDDSIVRGTTSRKIIELIRNAGAKEVYLLSTCPPIEYPCYYGIDFPSKRELIAAGRSIGEIEKELGADAVVFQGLEGLQAALADASWAHSQEKSHFLPCMACLDGKYPTDVSEGQSLGLKRESDRELERKKERSTK